LIHEVHEELLHDLQCEEVHDPEAQDEEVREESLEPSQNLTRRLSTFDE
jgi:hypothetical protein